MQLLKETNLTSEKAIQICHASESAMAQLKTFSDEKELAELDTVHRANEGTMSNIIKVNLCQGSRGRAESVAAGNPEERTISLNAVIQRKKYRWWKN